jgi:soluble lytic murein transglycosylase-like protein
MASTKLSRFKFVWTRKRIVMIITLVAGLLGIATSASAQIYSWRDASGNLVLSNRRPAQGEDVKSYAVPDSQSTRATRSATHGQLQAYDDLIRENARQNGVRTDLVRAVVQVESAFNPYARSNKGALGLMQLMPATIRQYGVTNPFDPIQNIRAGVAYLRTLLDRYQNKEELALAAYNAGPGAVDKHRQSVPPYQETRDYVAHINRIAARPIEVRNSQIFKIVDLVDGRPVVRYTDQKPASGSYEVVTR